MRVHAGGTENLTLLRVLQASTVIMIQLMRLLSILFLRK